jgi:hypothetical protein
MYPFGVIGVAPRYIPAGAVIELAGFRLGCTSTPTGIRETQAGGNRIQGHSSRGGSESERIPAGVSKTYPVVVPNRAPFRQKSPRDCTRPLP